MRVTIIAAFITVHACTWRAISTPTRLKGFPSLVKPGLGGVYHVVSQNYWQS